MNQFINHVDHLVWLAELRQQHAYAEQLSALCGVELLGPYDRPDIGIRIYISPRGGLEVIASLEGVETPFNMALNEQLRTNGEGIVAVVFGVPDITKAQDRARSLGYEPGEPMTNEVYPGSGPPPWADQYLDLKESTIGNLMNTMLIFGEIVYRDGVILTSKDA